jgi:hypothetical protein
MSGRTIGRFGPGLGLILAAIGCSTGGAVTSPGVPGGGPAAPALPSTATAPPVATQPAAGVPAIPALMSAADLDRMMAVSWERAHATPAEISDDSEFLRRVTLDVAGRVPTLDEAEHFLADRAPDKRRTLVAALLAGPDYAEHWADVLLDLFVGRQFRKPRLEKKLDPRAYFVTAFRENRGFDQIAREMLTFTGEILPNGPGVFLASHLKGGGPEMAASVTARLFMGVQIQCAQCHDHPYDARYKQEDFYALVAYFVRTKHREEKRPVEVTAGAVVGAAVDGAGGSKPAPEGEPAGMAGSDGVPAAAPSRTPDAGMPDNKPDNKIYSIIDRPNGQAKFKKSGADHETVVRPKFFGREVPPLPGETPRETLARAVVESDLFAKTMVDRTWAQLFGRGIVDPWDDLGGEKDPRHPQLLTALADDFRSSGFDVKHLLQTVLLSRAYGLTSRATPTASTEIPAAPDAATETPVDPTAVFARAAVRRLTPEQLFQSLLVASGADHMQQRPGTEGMEKKNERLLREYLFVFGDDEMAEINTFNGNIPQALLMWNGEITNQGARARAGGTLARILDGNPTPDARLRKMFLAAYARAPTDVERARLLPALAAAASGRGAYEDLFFALLTSTEMLTTH